MALRRKIAEALRVTLVAQSEQSVSHLNTGQQRVPIRATDPKNPRGQTPALAYEPEGRTFESCWAAPTFAHEPGTEGGVMPTLNRSTAG